MRNKKPKSLRTTDLRKEAEKKVGSEKLKPVQELSAEEARQLIHELQTHEIELEMQREELLASQEQLEESRSNYSDLYDFAPVGYFTLDKNGDILAVNLTGASQLGLERGSLTGKPFSRFVHRDDQDLFLLHRRKILQEKTAHTCEVRLKRKDGVEICAQLVCRPVQDHQGGVRQIRAALIDITERKNAEENLNLFHDLIDQTNDCAFVADVETASLLYANRKAVESLGYSREELLDLKVMDIQEVIPDMSRWREVVRSIREKGSGMIEGRHRRKDGTSFPVEVSVRFVTQKTRSYMVAVSRNITERKRRDQELEQALDESRQRSIETTALLEGSRTVLKSQDFADTARAIFDSCKELIGAAAGYVALLSEQGTENHVLFLDPGGLPCTVDADLPMPIRGLRADAYRKGQAVYDNDFSRSHWMKYMPEGHVHVENVLFAPLMIQNKAVGLLGLSNKPGGFTENDARMAAAFGELASIALQNSRLLESLQEREERFRSVVETAHDGIISADSRGHITYWNPGAEAIFGYKASEVVGKPLIVIMPERFHGAHAEGIRNISSSQQSEIIGKTLTLTGKSKDGIEFPMELNLATWGTREGLFFTGIVRDITERKKAEHEISNLAKFPSENPHPVLRVGHDNSILYLNEAVTRLLKKERLSEKDIFEILPHHSKELIKQALDTSQAFHDLEFNLGDRTYSFSMSPVSGNQYVNLYATDITERKRIERELRKHREHLEELVDERTLDLTATNEQLRLEIAERKEAEKLLTQSEKKYRGLSQEFHTLLDAMPEAILLVSPDMKVLWANRGASELLEKKVSEIPGQYCFSLWRGVEVNCRNCHAKKSIESGKPYQQQFCDSNGRILDALAFPILNRVGDASKVIIVYRDITEKITLEAEAMRAAHLASLGELAAGVAHEINNPINGIINYAQILSDELDEDRDERDIANRILKEGDRIALIVRNLLSFARDRREQKSPVDLVDLLQDALALTKTQIHQEGIDLIVETPRDLPKIIAQPQQIQQVFLNIINNARYALNQKYSGKHEDKIFKIRCEKKSIDDRPYVRITFHDHGTGIPSDMKDKVFHPFFSTKPADKGTGLGLSISHGILTNHESRLSIDTVEGEYTRMIIDMPVQ